MTSKLGLVIGSGQLPKQIIANLQKADKDYFIIAIKGEVDLALDALPHQWFAIGEVGRAIEVLKNQGVNQICFAGYVKRPAFSDIKIDTGGFKLLANITKEKLLGDDKLLKIVINFFENHGFEVVAPELFADKIIVPQGKISQQMPTKEQLVDIESGFAIAKAIGALDIGQGVIIENGYILGVEAAEGTDQLIERCSKLKKTKAGILIKVKKPNQITRIDLPTIGPKTIKTLHHAGFSGVAIEQGCLILDLEQVKIEATRLGIFVFGI